MVSMLWKIRFESSNQDLSNTALNSWVKIRISIGNRTGPSKIKD